MHNQHIVWNLLCNLSPNQIGKLASHEPVIATPHPGNLPISDIHIAREHNVKLFLFETIKGDKKIFLPSGVRLEGNFYDISTDVTQKLFVTSLKTDESKKRELVEALKKIDLAGARELLNLVEESKNPAHLHYIVAKGLLGENVALLTDYLLENVDIVTASLEALVQDEPTVFNRHLDSHGRVSELEKVDHLQASYVDGSKMPLNKLVEVTLGTMKKTLNVLKEGVYERSEPGILLDAAVYWGLICAIETRRQRPGSATTINFLSGAMLAKYLFHLPTAQKTRAWYDRIYSIIKKAVPRDAPERIRCNIIQLDTYRKIIGLSSNNNSDFVEAYAEYRSAYLGEVGARKERAIRLNSRFDFASYDPLSDNEFKNLDGCLKLEGVKDHVQLTNPREVDESKREEYRLRVKRGIVKRIFTGYTRIGSFEQEKFETEAARKRLKESRLALSSLESCSSFDAYLKSGATYCPTLVEDMTEKDLVKMVHLQVK